MYEYLVENARTNVWCNPVQDNQHVFWPERITTGSGSVNTFFLFERTVSLPVSKKRYQVYQVGQLPPSLLNLIEREPSWSNEKWFTFGEAMNKLDLYTTIYTEKGVVIPRFNAWFMFTREKCLIFCVPEDDRLGIRLQDEHVYFRVYTNAYYKSEQAQAAGARIEIKGYEPLTTNAVIALQQEFNASKVRNGLTEAFVNGFQVKELSLVTVKPGDICEWVYDYSVKRIVTFTYRDLLPFHSTLDDTQKLLLHYDAPDLDMIDYQDDIDLYVQTPEVLGQYKGRYYLKNNPQAMRNVTHRDYSVPGSYVSFLAQHLAEDLKMVTPELLDFKVMMKVREGGYHRKLIYDNARIFELYKLDDEEVLSAMIGVNSLVPEWQAASLEANAYTEIMRSRWIDIDIDLVQRAYGYNSISQILADTPTKTYFNSGNQRAKLAEELQQDSTIYEFDETGAMLGWHYHANDNDYEARDQRCRMIEGIVGKGGDAPYVKYGTDNIPFSPLNDNRVYYCRLFNGVPDNNWIDITGDARYTVVNNTLKWISTETDQWLMVRSNVNFLAYDFTLRASSGVLAFTLGETTDQGSGLQFAPMNVPMGDLQIWLNDKYNLIQGIDYIVKFPNVYINCYQYLNQPGDSAEQKVHVRFTGFCSKDMKMYTPQQLGFVEHGALSNNRKYNLRDDKVQHISVYGKVYHREDLKFFEDKPGYDIQNPLNGTPYQIKDILVPLKQYTQEDTYSLKRKAADIDRRVSEYLTLYIHGSSDWINSSSRRRYRLVSQFFTHILYRLENGLIYINDQTVYTDTQVMQMCKPYEWLLAVDPLSDEYSWPEKFVEVAPTRRNTPINISRAQWRFAKQVEKLYGKGRVQINDFVTFTIV